MNKKEKERFSEEMIIRALSPQTVRAYEGSLRDFFKFYEGRAAKALCIPEIKIYQRHLIEKDFSPNTVNRHMTAVRVFYRWVYERYHYTADCLPRVRAPKHQPVILSREEVKRMIESVDKPFYKAVLMTLYSTGMRNNELRNLKITDIDRDRMVITVKEGKGKKDRQALLSPVTLKYLEEYWISDRKNKKLKSDYLFTPTKNSLNGNLDKVLSHTALGYIIDVAVRAAGVKKKSAHILLGTPLQYTF